MRGFFNVISLVTIVATSAYGAGEPASFDQAVLPFLNEHCIRCHGAEKQKGDFRLDTLSRDFAMIRLRTMGEVMFRINSGKMPPKKETQPAPTIWDMWSVGFLSRLDEGLGGADGERGPVAHYRLSRDDNMGTRFTTFWAFTTM